MKEKTLRQIHRSAGVILAFFIIIQTFSGVLLSLHILPAGSIPGVIHFQLGITGTLYRIILGLGILWMAFSGLWINMKIRARSVSK
jgi:uncharacterized iron-regulated membrane protein